MLDRVTISVNDKTGDVLCEIRNEDDVPIQRIAVPANEWNELQDKVIESLKGDHDFYALIQYLIVFALHLETC